MQFSILQIAEEKKMKSCFFKLMDLKIFIQVKQI